MPDNAEPTLLERLHSEFEELNAKIDALDAFLRGEEAAAISDMERALLKVQRGAMQTYHHVVTLRMGMVAEARAVVDAVEAKL